MPRKIALTLLATLLLLVFASYYLILSPQRETTADGLRKRYSVLMIVSDALRRDVLGCYGGQAVTPNIDRLAENGVLFENAYSTSPWTAPSAVSMFTGNYATTYTFSQLINTVQIHVPQSEHLLVEFLKERGYLTHMKIENDQASIHGNLQGFESLPDVRQFEQTVPVHMIEQIQSITGTFPGGSAAYKNSLIFLNHLFNMPSDKYFFTLHWMDDPHCPYSPITKFRTMIDVDRSSLTKPEKHYSSCIKETPELNVQEEKFIKDLYAAEVESVDERVGFALEILEQQNRIENTIIIFTSDHGELFGEHGRFGHGWFGHDCHYFENLIRVPLIIAGADLPKGERRTTNVSLIDLIPTLKDLLGAEYEQDMQGRSFAQVLLNKSKDNRVMYFDDVREHDQVDALLDDKYKLICFEGDKYELYDLSIDAEEQHNLAPLSPELAESIYSQILKIREENAIRRSKNEAAFDASTDILDINKKKMIEKLRSLGYIE
jgi:arylsulfatase A-like enzyme